MADKPDLVHVQIFGQSYAVRGGAEPGYVERLAAYVDAQMQEVSRVPGTVDSLRIAVLAALNIADECFRAKANAAGGGSALEARAAGLARELEAALEE
jgi:cell division protein ZapA